MNNSKLTIQQQLFNALSVKFPDAIAKKIDRDNHLDIFIPSIHEKKGYHLFFNTSRNKIKAGFYCKDTEFLNKVFESDDSFELTSRGIRLLNNPVFTEPDLAVNAIEYLLIKIKEAYYGVNENQIKVEAFTKASERPELITAIDSGFGIDKIKKIIRLNPNSLFETDTFEEGYTALHYAAWDNNVDCVKLLLKSGAEIDPVGNDGLSPFLLAANNGFYEIIEILADNGADINRITQDPEDPYQGVSGTSAIRTALLNQSWEVVDFLMKRDVELEILLEPCYRLPISDFFEVIRAVGASNVNIVNDPDEVNAYEELVKERLNSNSEKKEVAQENELEVEKQKATEGQIDQSYWTPVLEGYAEDPCYSGQIVILEISEEDLKEGKTSGIYTKHKINYGDWNALLEIFPEKEVGLIKEDLINYEAEIASSDPESFSFHTILLYSEGNYITQINDYQQESNEIFESEQNSSKRKVGNKTTENKNITKEQEEELKEDNKGYPALTVRRKKDDSGNNDDELNARISEYLVNWQCPTESYNWRMGIEGRVPSWISKIDTDECCPQFSDKEIEFVNKKILAEKIIPVLSYTPEEFLYQTKNVWWIVPFSIWAGDKASWLFVDKNGIYGAHPGDEDIAMIIPWDRIESLEYQSYDSDTEEEEIHSIDLNFDNGMLTLVEFVPPGRGSYLSIIESIYEVRYETIEASKGAPSWYEGVGGEGLKEFENPANLLSDDKWDNPNRLDPRMFGYDVRTEEEKIADHHLEQGKEKHENKDFQGAIQEFTRVIEINPNNYSAFHQRGKAKVELKDYQGAIDDYNNAEGINQEDDDLFKDRAIAKREIKDINGAIEDLNRAIEINSNWWGYYSTRGSAREELKEYQGALEDFSKVIELGRKSSVSYFYRGSVKSKLKDYQGAIEDFNKTIELDPEWINVYQHRGVAKSSLKDYQGAIEDFSKAIELDSNWWGYYYSRGDAKKNLKDYHGAIQEFTRVIEIDPNNKDAFHQRGKAKVAIKDYLGAIEDFSKVIEIDPNYKWAYQERGKTKKNADDYHGAIEDFSKVIEIDPSYKWAYQERGEARSLKKDFNNAIIDFNKVIEIDPNYKWAYESLGKAKSNIEDYAGAIESYDMAIEKGANWSNIYYNRGLARHDLNDFEGAMEDYMKAMANNTHFNDVHRYYNIELAKNKLKSYRGDILALKGDSLDATYLKAYLNRALELSEGKHYEKAIEELNRVVEIDSNHAEAFFLRGDTKRILKDFHGAIEDYDKSIALNPENDVAFNLRADVKYDVDDFQGAIEDFTKAIEFGTDNVYKYYFNRGCTNEELNDYQSAINDYDKAIELNPGYESAYSKRAKAKMEIGNVAGAIEDFSKMIEKNPYELYYLYRGNAYKDIEDYQNALKDYDAAIEIDYENRAFHLRKSEVKLLLGDVSGAELDKNISTLFEYFEGTRIDFVKRKFTEFESKEKDNGVDWISNSLIAIAKLTETEFETLSKDSNVLIRTATALNPYITPELLSGLLKDDEKQVRLSARKNTSCTEEMLENAPKEKILSILIYGEGSEFMQGMIPTEKYNEVLDIKNKTETDNTSAWFEYLENNNEDYWDYNDISHLYGINQDNLHLEIWEDDISIFKSDSYWDIDEDIREGLQDNTNENISKEKGRWLDPSYLKAQNQVDAYKGVLVTCQSYDVGFEFRVELEVFEDFDWSKFGIIVASTDEMGLGTDYGDYCLGFKYGDKSYFAEFETKAKSQNIYFNKLR